MSQRIPAWSYSTLDSFLLCPKKYYAEKIAKSASEVTSEATNYGSEAHKHFEQRVKNGKKLPMDLAHHEKVVARLAGAPGDKYTEQKIALTADFKPTGFFDKDVWCRAVIDLIIVNDANGVIVDWKFGKMKQEFDQLDLMVAVVFALYPEMQGIKGMFYWAKEKEITAKSYTRDDIPTIWNDFLPKVKRFNEAFAKEEFPARPNYLCKRYCNVKSCPNHGV